MYYYENEHDPTRLNSANWNLILCIVIAVIFLAVLIWAIYYSTKFRAQLAIAQAQQKTIQQMIMSAASSNSNNNTSSVPFAQLSNNDKFDQAISTLVHQAARYANAAQQDTSPVIALLHSDYSVSLVDAVGQIATDDEIQQATGVSRIDLENQITAIQSQVALKVAEACPQFAQGINDQLAVEGGE